MGQVLDEVFIVWLTPVSFIYWGARDFSPISRSAFTWSFKLQHPIQISDSTNGGEWTAHQSGSFLQIALLTLVG
jgi:hypothetical protein